MAITAFETSGAITTGDSTDKASPAGPSRAPASRRRNWGSSASPSWVATVTEGGVTSLSTRSLGQFACRARSSYVLLKFKCETSSLDYDQFTFLRLCDMAEQSELIFFHFSSWYLLEKIHESLKYIGLELFPIILGL